MLIAPLPKALMGPSKSVLLRRVGNIPPLPAAGNAKRIRVTGAETDILTLKTLNSLIWADKSIHFGGVYGLQPYH